MNFNTGTERKQNMVVNTLSLSDFRNYEMQAFTFSEGINIFCGDNAQGKTNILEAVYLCGTGRSYRGSRDRDMIRFGREEAHVKLNGVKKEIPFRIDMHLKKSMRKGIAVNSAPIRKTSELLGMLHLVFFSPEDLQMIKMGPQERRRFVDTELCQLNSLYMQQLSEYNHCLMQRNSLLKDLTLHPGYIDTLDIWDEKMILSGKKIIEARRMFIEEISPVIADIHLELSKGREKLKVIYEPNVSEDAMETAFHKGRDRDLKTKMTGNGPHRDDISFEVSVIENGIWQEPADMRTFGSQGQQRTCALSTKLAEIEIIKKKTGETPVLLLDDVLSELDSGRQNSLLKSIEGIQAFITCTGLDDFVSHRFHMDRVFMIEKGRAVVSSQ